MAKLEFGLERGLRWSLMRQVITGLSGTVGVVILSRLLAPEDFGAVALAMLVYNGLITLISAAIRDAVVYYREEEDAYGTAAFLINLVFSVVALIIVEVVAGPLGHFYASPIAPQLTRAMALAFFFESLALVPAAFLMKSFSLPRHEAYQTIYLLVVSGGAIVMAFLGFGAWSLVVPRIIGAGLLAALNWLGTDFRPTLFPPVRIIKDVLRFGLSVLGANLLNYLMGNLDNAAIGTLGAGPLGLYSFAKQHSGFVLYYFGTLVSRAALPSLASLQDRLKELQKTYLDMLRLTAAISTPVQVGVLVTADLIFRLAFGEKWLPAVPVFRIYIAYYLVRTLVQLSDSVTSAVGRPQMPFVVNLVRLPLFAAGIWLGLEGGIGGVATALALVLGVTSLVYLYLTVRLIQIRLTTFLAYLGPSTLAGVLMGLLTYGARVAIAQRVESDWLRLSFAGMVAFATYFSLLMILDRRGFQDTIITFIQVLVPRSIRRRAMKLLVGYFPEDELVPQE